MPYTKQTWADGAGGGTPLSAARLNYIEDGIAIDDGGVQRLADGKLAAAAPNTYPAQMVSVHKALAADGWPATGLVVTISLPSAADFTYTYQVLYPQSATETSNPQIRWATSATAWSSWYTLWHSGNDGYGSGLVASDSDTVDGSHAVAFAAAGHNHDAAYVNASGDTMTGALAIAPAGNAAIEHGRTDGVASTPFIDFHSGATAVDYDSRLIASGGSGVAGGGTLQLIAAVLLAHTVRLRLYDGGGGTLDQADIYGQLSGTQRRIALKLSNGTSAIDPFVSFAMDKIRLGESTTSCNTEITAASTTPLHIFRYTNDGDLIAFFRDGTIKGSISVSGEIVSLNGFVGAHYTQLRPGQEAPPPFAVLIADDEFVPDSTPDRVTRYPLVSGTTSASDERVYGVWMGATEVAALPAQGGRPGEPALERRVGAPGRPLHLVATSGILAIRVTDEGGDIEPGKLLETSSRRYEARRQADSLVRASTVAKARGRVAWATVPIDPALGYKWAVVPCTMPY